jgi:hypothetical protein
VHCPNGPVMGGGYVLTYFSGPGSQESLRAIRSYPVDGNTWLVRAADDGGTDSWELTVSAVCAK